MHFILQWKCRGIKPNHQDLQSTIRWRNPFIVCLQETKIAPTMACSIKGYAVFRQDVPSTTIAHGGVLLAVHHSLPARPLLLSSPLQQARIQDFHRLGAAVTRAAHFPGHGGGMARGAALCANKV